MTNKIKLGKYQHYKGKYYDVIGLAYDSETLEEKVVYQALYNSKELGNNPIFVRPYEEFFENVIIDNKNIPRFKFIGEK
jgi:hypothetical protein